MLLLQVRHLCHALRGSERPFLLLFLLQRSLVLLLELRIYLCPSRRLVALSRRGLERVRDSLRLRFAICVALTLLFALAAVVESLVILGVEDVVRVLLAGFVSGRRLSPVRPLVSIVVDLRVADL